MKPSFSRSSLHLILLLSLLLSLAGGAMFATPAHAATYTVSNLNDSGPGSLRQAIISAIAAPGEETINFSISGTILLGSVLPTITGADALAIDGTGQSVTISGSNLHRILWTDPGTTVSLNHLTFSNGNDWGGGGIYNAGNMTIANSAFSGNKATNYMYGGGAVLNSDIGVLNIQNSTFSFNNSNGGGAGILNYGGTVTISGSTFSTNSSSGNGGGAINNWSGALEVANSTFSGNTDTSVGGAIYNDGVATITSNTFSSNFADYGYGGAFYNGGSASLNYNAFSTNSAFFDGGAFYNAGSASLINSTFSGNSSSGDGAGILSMAGTLNISNSTFADNTSNSKGGGVYVNGGTATFANSTFSDNSAAISGGGIHNTISTSIINSTFYGNSAPSGGNISNTAAVELYNSILSNSRGGGTNCSLDKEINDHGYNIADDDSCNLGSGSFSNTDPVLGTLADNGGSTLTFALLTGSPAIDAGDDAVCAAPPVNNTSQNGVIRPVGLHCDIGSYEKPEPTPPTVLSITRADPSPTTSANIHFSVTFSEAVTGVDAADFSLTSTGSISAASIIDVSGGAMVYTVTVNTGSGNGTIRLDVPASANFTDFSGNPPAGLPYTGGETYTIIEGFTIFLPLVRR
jgi:hypothetical protein